MFRESILRSSRPLLRRVQVRTYVTPPTKPEFNWVLAGGAAAVATGLYVYYRSAEEAQLRSRRTIGDMHQSSDIDHVAGISKKSIEEANKDAKRWLSGHRN